jgi:hypothetical protein
MQAAKPARSDVAIYGPSLAPHQASGGILVRYADNTIVCFQHEQEARTFLAELKERSDNSNWCCTRTKGSRR